MLRGPGFYTQTAIVALLVGMQAAAAQQTAATDNGTIEQVTVTATKRSTALEKTPVAISAISNDTLEQEHVQDVSDIVQLVPGFAAAPVAKPS